MTAAPQPQVWQLQKYARFVEKSERDVNETDIQGDWQYFEPIPPKNAIKITIGQPANLVIKRGKEVLESFTLLQSSDTFKVVAREDSMLFYYKTGQSVRRFRIQFAKAAKCTGVQNCNGFIQYFSRYVYVESVKSTGELASQNMSQSQKSGPEGSGDQSVPPFSVATVAKSICSKDLTSLPKYYGAGNLHVEDSTAPSLIKTCLLDPNFPAFVEEVEKQVLSMINS